MKTMFFKVVWSDFTHEFYINFRKSPSETYENVLIPANDVGGLENYMGVVDKFVASVNAGECPEFADITADIREIAEIEEEIRNLQKKSGELRRKCRKRIAGEVPKIVDTAIDRYPEYFV